MELVYYKWLFERLTPGMIIESSGAELLNDLFTTWFKLPKSSEVNPNFQNTIKTMKEWGLLRPFTKRGQATVYRVDSRKLNAMKL